MEQSPQDDMNLGKDYNPDDYMDGESSGEADPETIFLLSKRTQLTLIQMEQWLVGRVKAAKLRVSETPAGEQLDSQLTKAKSNRKLAAQEYTLALWRARLSAVREVAGTHPKEQMEVFTQQKESEDDIAKKAE